MTDLPSRRAVIAGAASANVMPLAINLGLAGDEPLLALCAEWRSGRERYYAALALEPDEIDDATDALDTEQHQLLDTIASTSPSTLRGFRAQLAVLRQAMRDLSRRGNGAGDPDEVLDAAIYRVLGFAERIV
jgi:hypothetical protein